MCTHPPQRTGVATAEGKTRPQTHGVDSVHLLRHFSSKSLPSTIQRPKARVNYQKMIIDPRYEPYTSGTGPEPNPRLGYQARPGRSRSRTWRVRVGQSGSLPGPCSTNLDRSWSLDGEDRSRTGRLRVGQSGSPTHCGPGPEPDLRPSYRAQAGPEPDLRPYQCCSDVLGLPSGRRQPTRTRDSVPAVLPDGPGLGWIHNEPSQRGRVRRPCSCR